MSDRNNLAALATGPTRRQLIAGVAISFGGLALGATEAWAGAEDGISRTRNPFTKRLFSRRAGSASTKHSSTPNSSTRSYNSVGHEIHAPGGKPTEISHEVGGAFTLFGGYITGRHVELVAEPANRAGLANGRLGSGVYSIVKFESWSEAPGPRSYLTIRVFLKARRKTWRQDGKRTIGSRSRNSWLRFCGGRRIATGGSTQMKKKPEPESDKINTPP